jgi:uncharacterized protein YbaP (TraB family)
VTITMKTLITSLLLFVPLLAGAKEKVDIASLKHPVKACLYKLEGNGLKKSSYLFGTIHLADPRVLKLHPNAEAAFKTCDTFYAEIDLDPEAQLQIAALIMRKDGKKLTEAIGPELSTKLNKVLKGINPTLNATPFEPVKTWAIAATLPLIKDQLTGKQALDSVLYQRAMNEKKNTAALESADAQVGLFDKFTEKEQQVMLTDSLDLMIAEQKLEIKAVERLLNVYLTGTTTEIAEFMTAEMTKMDSNPEFTKRLMKALLDDRNIGMADKANEFMQADPNKSHFFAVGAAHYTGKLAVQDLLEKKGYKITPLFE